METKRSALTKNQILEGNRIFAEFLKWDRVIGPDEDEKTAEEVAKTIFKYIIPQAFPFVTYSIKREMASEKYFGFYGNWNWLMYIVNKILEKDPKSAHLRIVLGRADMDLIYRRAILDVLALQDREEKDLIEKDGIIHQTI